jgi:2-polyprenyl-6-methoxyphenol hydroxylase-like FAD-dependent oxidoreductase
VKSLDVGVVGCGTAGAAVSLFLARAGHKVTIYERVPDPGPVGAGITLQPTGQAVMARLGLLAPILEHAARIDRLHAVRHGGRTLVDLRYAAVDQRFFGLGLHRGVLFTTLHDAVQREPGVTLRCGVGATGVEHAVDGVTVRSDAGVVARHDFVIAADGSVSELHASGGVPVDVREYPWGALWFVAQDPDRTFRDELYQVVRGARRMYGVLPTGRGPTGSSPVVSMFWSICVADHPRWREDGLAAWKAEVATYDKRIAPFLEQITDPSQVLLARYRDVRMKRWHGDRIVFLGDAAHAMSPQLGQGANLALWDAMTLADAMAAASSLADGLAAYSRARRRHLGHYQFMTRALTPLFQSSSGVLGWMRDRVMPIGNRIGPIRRLMVKTMIGLEQGIVRAPLRLPPG